MTKNAYSKVFFPNCKLPCTSLQAKAEKTGSDYCLAQLLEFWSRTFIRQPFEICLCNFQCCYLFELCILCAVCVHLNVVGSRYANLALLCILLPHELPPCLCTKFGVQNDFGVIFYPFPWDILLYFSFFLWLKLLTLRFLLYVLVLLYILFWSFYLVM